jgi:propanol-preferring alcohol dehydrogenase
VLNNFDDYLVYDGPSDKHSEWIQTKVGGVQVAIVTVPLIQAYEEACKSVKRGGRVIAVALPKGNISIPISIFVIKEIQLIGSYVGTRKDLQEALELAKLHKITCKVEKCKLEDINEVFEKMQNYKISGRVVIDFTAK